jgi:hypothetical protein
VVINGILLLYYQPLTASAPTVLEHVESIPAHSQFAVWPVNTALGFPSCLTTLRFRIVVLHYSLFGPPTVFGTWPAGLSPRFRRYLTKSADTYKIAFFQDEHHYCQSRFAFLNAYKIQCVYTLLDPKYWPDVYQKYTSVQTLVYTLTGYVSPDLVTRADRLVRADAERSIDVGYRARRLPFYMGRGGQEKSDIAIEFIRRCEGSGLTLDIAVNEESRIYGNGWWEFLADCRAVLGVEAGVSIFDLDDCARLECLRLLRSNPSLTYQEIHDRVLYKWEGNIPYRTISPRHFEAAALRVVQILFEGEYSGVLRPSIHYIPLKKDFSNFEQAMATFKDPAARRQLTDNAYRDLIASGMWRYETFVSTFDDELRRVGFNPEIQTSVRATITNRLNKNQLLRKLSGRLAMTRHASFPGRRVVASAARRLLRRG